MSRIDELNEQQMAAVTSDPDGAAIVVASPGSGKTRVLTERVAFMIGELGINASDVLVTTFTRRAADEMKDRLYPIIGDQVSSLRAGTIHSVCLRILHEERLAKELMSESEQRQVLRDILGYRRMNWDVGWRYPLGWIGKAKGGLVGVGESEAFFQQRLEPICGNRWQAMDLGQKLAICYKGYETEKRHLGRMDYADMLCWVGTRLRDDPSFRSRWQRRVKFVLVDEAQDTGYLAYSILRTLAEPESRFFAVGDPDQELFRWAGADPDHNIYGFLGFYPNGQIFPLETNYRSTRTIVDISNKAIEQNYADGDGDRMRFKKTVSPAPGAAEGNPVSVQACTDTDDEAEFVCRQIVEMLEEGRRQPQDIYVVYRVNSQSRPIEDAFLKARVPYVVQGSGGFYDRAVIKDMLAFMALVDDSSNDEAFERVCNIASKDFFKPTRAFGTRWKAECAALARGHGISMFDAMLRMRDRASRFYKGATDDFVRFIDGVREQCQRDAEDGTPIGKDPRVAVSVIRTQCYEPYLMRNEGITEQEALEKGLFDNLDELGHAVSQFETIAEFLEHVEEMRRLQEEARKENVNAVVLTTIHRVKGLERPVVFGIGLGEDILPHKLALGGSFTDQESQLPIENLSGLMDERCAMFVLVSRAKEELYLSYPTEYRNNPVSPSRFLVEMGLIEETDREDEPALVAASSAS